MTAYHVSPKRNRLAIRRWGLIPRDPYAGPNGWGVRNRGIEAVYVHVDFNGAHKWQWMYDEPTDVWAVKIDGLTTAADAYAGISEDLLVGAMRVLDRVAPERVHRVTARDLAEAA